MVVIDQNAAKNINFHAFFTQHYAHVQVYTVIIKLKRLTFNTCMRYVDFLTFSVMENISTTVFEVLICDIYYVL